jgi:hypothetical protein
MGATASRLKKLEQRKGGKCELYPKSVEVYGKEWVAEHIGFNRKATMKSIEESSYYDNAYLREFASVYATEIKDFENALTDSAAAEWRAIFEGDYDAPIFKPFFNANRLLGRFSDLQLELWCEFECRYVFTEEGNDYRTWWESESLKYPEAYKEGRRRQ